MIIRWRFRHSRPTSRRFIAQCVASLVVGVKPSLAQMISGAVVAASAPSGIPGVIVQLRDSGGIAVARTLSRADGAFFFLSSGRGRFTIRTQRLGFRASTFGPFVVGDTGLTGLRLVLDGLPVSLDGLRVTSSATCTTADAGDDGIGVLAAWEEARKSLLSSILSRGRQDLVVTTATYERVVAPASGRVVRQSVAQRSGRSDRPFVSPLPPERYAAEGYRETDSAGTTYRAPDADVFVSREFAESHCLRLTEGQSPREVGIAFGPRVDVPARRPDGAPFVDVDGVVWLDRQSNRLVRAEFRYTGVEEAVRAAGAGGALEFLYLPGGLAVVSSWSIRVPRLTIVGSIEGAPAALGSGAPAALRSRRRETVGERWEFGGELTGAAVGDSVVRRQAGAELYGLTTDARSHRAARGTRVALAGTSYTATSDSTGHYRVRDVLPGRYDVVALSDVAAHLQLPAASAATVTLHAGEARELTVETRDAEESVATRCGDQASGERAAILGIAITFAGSPISGALVEASWDDAYTIQTRGYGVRRVAALVRSDSAGRFFLCGVPRARPIELAVVADSTANAVLGSVRVRIPEENAYLRVSLSASVRIPIGPIQSPAPPRE